MVDIKAMLPDLRKLVVNLSDDMRVRSAEVEPIRLFLQNGYETYRDAGRISQSYEEWRDDYLEQVAVNWVLACVFVRFMEDNGLLDECWIAGEGIRRQWAEGAHELFFRQHPHDTDREYLKHTFTEIRKIPAARELFDEKKNSLWKVDPSGDACRRLLLFFREIDAEQGGLKRKFVAGSGLIADAYCGLAPQAQFLGDLYQDLSEHARKKYALLQTPEFVQKFILDHTLDRAVEDFGLKNLRVIDPACGSGHFLLGAFDRLFDLWMKPENGVSNPVVAAQNALESVFGVDINPFAIAITRFRLLLAAITASGTKKLNQQSYAWSVNLAVGDSLLWGRRPKFGNERQPIVVQGEIKFEEDIEKLGYEQPDELRRILGQGYHVVVGNPPYIIVRDKAQNAAYRQAYSTCHQKYSLGVPFTQRFWDLAIRKGERVKPNAEACSPSAGYIGMITANSFMKREFGKKLVEEFIPKSEITHVIDTSGAYVPGHGTPTVILLRRPDHFDKLKVRAVFGIKGEPTTPDDPAKGLVWESILRNVKDKDLQDEFTSSADVPRETFNAHPWSIGGGGASDLSAALEEHANQTLSDITDSIGITSFTLEDDVYILPLKVTSRIQVSQSQFREMVVGDLLRDWRGSACDPTIFPYDAAFCPTKEDLTQPVFRYLWSFRTNLANSKMFGGKTKVQSGLAWYEYGRLTHTKLQTPLSIAFAFVATHSHFVLDRGGKVFNRSAPIIKLPAEATEDEHLALLGLLNSSTACFWMKQTFHNKGGQGVNEGAKAEHWEKFYEFTGTGLERFPLPTGKPLLLAFGLDQSAQRLAQLSPDRILAAWINVTDLGHLLQDAEYASLTGRMKMISLQEELDWECYRHYGLLSEDLCYPGDDLPELKLGERAFEIVVARQMAQGQLKTAWFDRHGSTPITELPAHWKPAYRKLVERRIQVIGANKEIALIEKPEYKRRWNTEPWAEQQKRALENWLLDRLETPKYRKGTKDHPELTTTAQLADVASADAEFLQVAALYRGRPDFDVAALVAELVEAESVPLLPILRYKPAGLRKREVWERTWNLQRQQDAGKDVGDIPVPPKYGSTDFLKPDYWRLRGKLDVPKERWVSYPHCSTDSDPTLVIGWAGWNHLEQATALIAYYDARKREGWDAKRLTPLLTGLDQLLPWIHQWHTEIDAEFGETAGQSFQAMLAHDAHELGLTLEAVRSWTPPEKTRKARTPGKKKAPAGDRDDA